jgi:hypothetical protein
MAGRPKVRIMADDQDNGQVDGDDEPELTPEEAKAKLREYKASVAKLEEASRKASREAKLLREKEQARAEADRKRQLSERPEADRWEHEKRELLADKERIERERDEERQTAIKDRQDIQIRDAITRMPDTAPRIDPDFSAEVCWKVDRELFEVDDKGKITNGLSQALAKVARENPKYLIQKPVQKGSGPANRGDGNNRQQNNNNRESNNPFFEKTSFNT